MKDEITAIQKIIDTLVEFGVNYGFQVVGAFVVLLLGMAAATWSAKLIFSLLQRRNIDITLSQFLSGLVKILIITFAVIIALGKFGITIAPFIAALGAAAFGTSFALQGPLSNYGAGLVIILTRPFVVGNTISVAGASGVVEEIKLACTVLNNEEGELITIPNKSIIGEILHNSQESKMVPGQVGISYDSDPEKAIAIIRQILSKRDDVNQENLPIIGIEGFGDSSVDIGFRYWVETKKYYATSYAINLAVFNALKAESIEIPFPIRDVRMTRAE
ncbi:MAG: mechanosensitive ion channel family protein [Desulfobacteraceae bacterium]|nr:MAG: mechanosensitive ion channel family protein [Desulfobacteraceae bacterium]